MSPKKEKTTIDLNMWFICSRNKFCVNRVWSFYHKQPVVLILPELYKYGAWFVCDTSDLSLNHIPSRGMEFLPHNHGSRFERPPSLHETSYLPCWCHKCFCSSFGRTPCNNIVLPRPWYQVPSAAGECSI